MSQRQSVDARLTTAEAPHRSAQRLAPPGQPLRLLLIEDSPDDAQLLLRLLRRGGYEPSCERVETAAAMEQALAHQEWDIIIADYALPHFSGLAAARLLRDKGIDLPFILISGAVGEDIAVEAMKAGAHDFVTKGNPARLVPAIQRELREAEIRRERRHVEEQLRQSQRLEAAGRLASGVAHELNNQLTVIKGCVQFLLAELPADDPRRRDAERIDTTVDRGSRLARQLLAFSREQPIELEPLDLSALVQDMAPMLRLLLRTNGVLHCDAAPKLWPVLADRQQLEQVIINLVLNARDALEVRGASSGEGAVTIETTNVHLEPSRMRLLGAATRSGPYVLLSLSDTGLGMTADVQARIFEPFFTTKEHGKGTGLGLSAVFGIVRQHEGLIECDSAPGQGTTFRIYLPRADHVRAFGEANTGAQQELT